MENFAVHMLIGLRDDKKKHYEQSYKKIINTRKKMGRLQDERGTVWKREEEIMGNIISSYRIIIHVMRGFLPWFCLICGLQRKYATAGGG